MLEYKAKLVGITVVRVNEAYTSQQCSKCGHVKKRNRKLRGSFYCQGCGFCRNTDHNAFRHILQNVTIDSQVVLTGSVPSNVSGLPDSGCVTHLVQNSFKRVG